MIYLYFAALCFATLAAILGRRSHVTALFAVMVALACLRNLGPGEASPSLTVAAYVLLGVCLAAALSGLSREALRAHRPVILSSVGFFSSLGLLALGMWLDQRALVITALPLVVVAFVVMTIVMVRWSMGGHANDAPLGQ